MKHAYLIVILLVLKSRLKTTESFVCEPPSVYHQHTRTCVRLVKLKLDYFKARSYCEYNLTGRADRKTQGHLMFIFNNETNSFIKAIINSPNLEQLKTWNFEKMMIGLHDAVLHKYYTWEAINHQSYNATYFDWATPSYLEDRSKRSVVITSSGWQKHDINTPDDFICQSDSGPPDCPSQFDVKLINNDSVIISWTPGHNGGLTQTFVFYSHTNTSLDRTLVAAVVDDNKECMVYTTRDLNMNTTLVFSVQVQNMLNTTECPHLNVSLMISANGTVGTKKGPKQEPSTMYLAIAFLGVVLIAALLAFVVVRFRRQYSYNQKTYKNKECKAEMEVLNNLYGLQDIILYSNNTE